MCNISVYTEIFINKEQKEKLNKFLEDSNTDVSVLMQNLLHNFISSLPPNDLTGLDKLVKDIFDTIPSYYDEREAHEIKKLIISYIKTLEHTTS